MVLSGMGRSIVSDRGRFGSRTFGVEKLLLVKFPFGEINVSADASVVGAAKVVVRYGSRHNVWSLTLYISGYQ